MGVPVRVSQSCQCLLRLNDMPPRRATAAKPLPRPPAAPSSHTEIITLGSRQLVAGHSSRLNENGLLPSTSRALVLRNGKQGAMGTGELMSLRKPIGREKLDLLGGKPYSDFVK
jgi:hypothetical protein